MTPEEYLRFLRKMKLGRKDYESAKQSFQNAFIHQLQPFIFVYWKHLETFRKEIRKPLHSLLVKYAIITFNHFNSALESLHSGDDLPQQQSIPEPLTLDSAEKEIEQFCKEYPEIDPKDWRNAVMPDFKDEMESNHFLHGIHLHIKKAITQVFEDELMLMDKEQLIYLDRVIFHNITKSFAQDFYTLENDIKKADL